MFQALLQLLGNRVDDAQTLLIDNPNTSRSTDPCHSQLAKDHDTQPVSNLGGQNTYLTSALERIKQTGTDEEHS